MASNLFQALVEDAEQGVAWAEDELPETRVALKALVARLDGWAGTQLAAVLPSSPPEPEVEGTGAGIVPQSVVPSPAAAQAPAPAASAPATAPGAPPLAVPSESAASPSPEGPTTLATASSPIGETSSELTPEQVENESLKAEVAKLRAELANQPPPAQPAQA